VLPGGGIVIGICAAPTAGDGIGIGMLPPPPGIGVGNCMGPEDGLGANPCITWPGGGPSADLDVLGVPRFGPMKGVEPAGAGGITGPC
jgi:hypothetical protein